MSINRREFLATLGGAAAGYVASRLPLRNLIGLEACEYESVPAVERWVRTCCQLCPGACGMEIRTVDGNAVGVRGNLLHPISRGGLCPVGAEAMHVLYSADRIKAPLRRVAGVRGDGEWKRVTWKAALEQVAQRILAIKERGRADEIFLLDGYGRGLLSGLSRRFLEGLGSQNHFLERTPDPLRTGMLLTQGIGELPAYDLERTRTLLSFGVPLLEGWHSPIQGQRAVGGIRGARAEGRSRSLIHLDVRSSRTAHRADIFHRIKPGSFGAAALAIAYVLVKRGLYDRDFVEQHSFGFDDWKDDQGIAHTGFKTFLLRECRPQDLEPVTGLPTRDIVEIASRFGEERPSLAIVDGTATAQSNGAFTAMAVHALNALSGAVDRPGGSLLSDPVPFASFPEFPAGQGAVEAAFGKRSEEYPFALRDVEAMQREVKNRGGKIGVLFLVHANPFYSTPSAERLLEVLDENSLVVSFSPLPDESGRYADYVLPDHSFLERWQDAVGPSTFPNAVLGLTRPVSHPLFDTRHCGDVLLDLARRTVAGGRQSFPWSSFEDLLKWSVQGVFRARRGSVFTTHQEAAEIRQMERRGWWIPSHPSFTAFWNDALATGGWWDPSYPHGLWGRAFRTPSRHFEFFSRGLSLQVHARDEGGVNGTGSDPGQVEKRLEALGIESTGDTAFLPHYEPPKFEGERNGHTLLLQLTRPMVPNTAVAATLPWVRELMSDRVAWETWVEIHAEDAGKLHLGTGDLVRVSAGSKSFLARAVITDSVPQGLISVPYGLGRPAGGRIARKRGTHPGSVIVPELEKLGGNLQWQGTVVRVSRAVEGISHA